MTKQENRNLSPKRIWIGAIMLVMFVSSQSISRCSTPRPGTASDFPTRDLNIVRPGCDPVIFIVSLNDDDDNRNGSRDLNGRIDPQRENNLRQFDFNYPDAKTVYIAEPVFVRGGTSAVGRKNRVRAYKANRKSKFRFNRSYDVPVTMYLEGVNASATPLDFGFEYQYADKDGKWLCGGGAQGTVVDVTAQLSVQKGSGRNFSKYNKMLIGVSGQASASVSPRLGSHVWSYDGVATIGAPTELATSFQAGLTITPENQRDQEQLRFRLTEAGLVIEAHLPVNITAPVHARATDGWTNGRPKDSPRPLGLWFNADEGTFSLFRTHIYYKLLDQFRAPIKRSAWGNRMVQDRENIGRVLTSRIPRVRAWIRNDLRWTRQWRNKPNGMINDRLRVLGITNDYLLARPNPNNPNRRRFHRILRRQGGILMNLGSARHEWEASVNGDIPTGLTRNVVTRNEFSVVVLSTRKHGGDVEIRLRSTYRIHTP